MYALTIFDLSNVGGPMGMNYPIQKGIKYFLDKEKAKQFAEKQFGKSLLWKESEKGILHGSSENENYAYFINEIQPEDDASEQI